MRRIAARIRSIVPGPWVFLTLVGGLTGCATEPTERNDESALMAETRGVADGFDFSGDAIALARASPEEPAFESDDLEFDLEPEAPPTEGEPVVEARTGTPARALGNTEGVLEPTPPGLAELAAYLDRRASAAEDPVPFLMARALLAAVAADPALAGSLPPFERRSEELVADEDELLVALVAFADSIRAGADEAGDPRAAVLAAAGGLVDALEDRPAFRIAGTEICEEVRAYGDVVRISPRMPAMQDREVLVYVPLEGLSWVPDPNAAPERRHRWNVAYRIELHQLRDDLVVMSSDWETIGDALPTVVRDTHFWVRRTIPGRSLAAGRYVLKVSVKDMNLEPPALAEHSIELQLLPGDLAAVPAADDGARPR